MAFLHCLLAPLFENDLPSLVARVATDQTLHERQDMETLRGSSMPQPADVSVTIQMRSSLGYESRGDDESDARPKRQK
jgi:hypothetical protein